MPKIFTSKSQKTGEVGEFIACRYLKNKGFSIVERNYTKKWGEIDIIAQKEGVTHFVEVKSKEVLGLQSIKQDGYRPEDAMHPWKLSRLKRTIQTYLLENDVAGDWQLDLAIVYFSTITKEGKVEILENVGV